MITRVLIIEDNADNLELMRYLFQSFGYTVLSATDGARGLEAARRELPDLIVCDVLLPEIDGYAIARRLKSSEEMNSIPLIAVTALTNVGDRERVLSEGFDGYIAKPIDPETFVEQIEEFARTGSVLSFRAGLR